MILSRYLNNHYLTGNIRVVPRNGKSHCLVNKPVSKTFIILQKLYGAYASPPCLFLVHILTTNNSLGIFEPIVQCPETQLVVEQWETYKICTWYVEGRRFQASISALLLLTTGNVWLIPSQGVHNSTKIIRVIPDDS